MWFVADANMKKAVLFGYRHLSCTLHLCKNLGAMVGQMLKYQWWLHKVWCVLYVSSATHILCMHQIQNVVVGHRAFDFIFLNVFVIIVAFLTWKNMCWWVMRHYWWWADSNKTLINKTHRKFSCFSDPLLRPWTLNFNSGMNMKHLRTSVWHGFVKQTQSCTLLTLKLHHKKRRIS